MSKILIIDDQIDIRETLGEFLELQDYEVLMAVNGLEGINCISKELPDLILCDIAMPEGDGFKVLEFAKSLTADTPFVFITSNDRKEDIKKGKLAGADAWLTKPFSTESLMDVIKRLMEEKNRQL